METYCAFFRGVNLNGITMKMAEACEVLRQAGLSGAIPVLASGNVIFQSDMPQNELRSFLERELSKHYNADVNIFVKRSDEVLAILSETPFVEDTELHTYTFICEPGFEEILLQEFTRLYPAKKKRRKSKAACSTGNAEKGLLSIRGFQKSSGAKI